MVYIAVYIVVYIVVYVAVYIVVYIAVYMITDKIVYSLDTYPSLVSESQTRNKYM